MSTSTTLRGGRQLLVMLGEEVRRCAELWVIGGDFNMEPEAFGQFATPARLPGVLVAPTIPTFRHGASVRRFAISWCTMLWRARSWRYRCWRTLASARTTLFVCG